MLEGRFILGIGPGGLRSDWEVFGNLDADRNGCSSSASTRCSRSGRAMRRTTRRQILEHQHAQDAAARSRTRRNPQALPATASAEIVVTVVVPNSKGLTAAAARGWHPISANFIHPHWVATHWPTYKEGCERGGHAIARRRLARRAQHFRRGRRGDRAALRARPERRIRLLLLEPHDQAPRSRHARHVQARPRDVRTRSARSTTC